VSGVCGIIDLSGRPVLPADVDAMASAAAYRGDDGLGTWQSSFASFVYQASHVTPESVRERQPFEEPASGLVVMADARIDNRTEMIDALRPHAPGAPVGYAAWTDVDIVVAAFLTWGDDAAARLIGDFAIVTWDPKRRRLFAAVDPMGMRSLAYWWDGRRLVFATEVHQVLAAPDVPVRLFEPAIAAHLISDYEHHAWTPYEGVLRLTPGHALIVEDGNVRLTRTWDVDPSARSGVRSEADHADMFRTLFAQAVDARLRSRRGIGTLLSGGVDSGSVASMAGTLLRARGADTAAYRTYSWAFDELHEIDERHISDQIVDHFGFTAVAVAAERHGPLSDPPEHGSMRDGPFCSVYQALIQQALRHARDDGVGLMLVGLRGDVLVGESVTDTLGLLLNGHWRAVALELQAYRRLRRATLRSAVRRMLVQPAVATIASLPAFAGVARPPRPSRKQPPPWVRADFLERTGLAEPSTSATHAPPGLHGEVRRRRYEAVFANLVASAMTWSEKLHAEAGIALADPWSDRRLAEFVMATPPWMVQRLHVPKRLAREGMRGVMPEAVRSSLAKVAPYPLYRRALEHSAVHVIEDLIRDPITAAHGFIDADALRAHYADVRSGARDHAGLWPTLTLEVWLRAHHAM